MSTRTLLWFAALGLAAAVSVQPQEMGMEAQFPQQQSAGDLLRACASSRLSQTGRERRRYCAGFVSGVEEAVRLLQRSGQLDSRVCPPANVSASSLAGVYVAYGAGHEGELRRPAAEMVLHALSEAYPCPGGPRS